MVNVAGRRKQYLDLYIELMLGTDKSRAYCPEMICADFLAGVSLGAGQENTLFLALVRLIRALPVARKLQLLDLVRKNHEPGPKEAPATEA